ncbi:hypothetical protein ACS0TY_023786 [Phlomoides rotata]
MPHILAIAPDTVPPVMIRIALEGFEQVKKADFILCNTVEELEVNTLSALNQIPAARNGLRDWLNSKPAGSVLYISFGSHIKLNEHDIKEIAHGLLLSRVNFIYGSSGLIMWTQTGKMFILWGFLMMWRIEGLSYRGAIRAQSCLVGPSEDF